MLYQTQSNVSFMCSGKLVMNANLIKSLIKIWRYRGLVEWLISVHLKYLNKNLQMMILLYLKILLPENWTHFKTNPTFTDLQSQWEHLSLFLSNRNQWCPLTKEHLNQRRQKNNWKKKKKWGKSSKNWKIRFWTTSKKYKKISKMCMRK